MYKYRKALSALLVAAFMFNFVSCRKGGEESVSDETYETSDDGTLILTEESRWFEQERSYYDIYQNDYHQTMCWAKLCTSEYIYAIEMGENFIGTSWNDYVYESETKLLKLDYAGSIVSEIDLSEYNDTQSMNRTTIAGAFLWNDEFYIAVDETEYTSYENTVKFVKIDTENNSVAEEMVIDGLSEFENRESAFPRDFFEYDGKLVVVCYDYDNAVKIGLVSEDGSVDEIDVSSFITENFITSYGASRMLDDRMLLIRCDSFEDGVYFLLDLETSEITAIPDDEVLRDFENAFIFSDMPSQVGLYYSDDYGVYKYNYEENSKETVLLFNDCNCNRNELGSLEFISATDDGFVFWGMKMSGYMNARWMSIKLVPSEFDAREGKIILKAACLGSFFSEEIAEAIYRFNATSEEYYILLTEEFNRENFYDVYSGYVTAESERERLNNEINGEYQLSNALAISLIEGTGPDIIFNGYQYTQLNSSNCLLDLSQYFDAADGIDTSELLPAVISDTNYGGVYQIPITVSLAGMLYRDNPFEETAVTYDQYFNAVDTLNNGFDPFVWFSRQELFFELLDDYPSDFIEDGVVDFGEDGFRDIADYSALHSEWSLSAYPDFEASVVDSSPNVINYGYWSIPGIAHMASEYSEGIIPRIYGYPGNDGNSTPVIRCNTSVGISANCSHIDGAIEFLNLLFSYEIQSVDVNAISVNTRALVDKNQDVIADYNNFVEFYNNSSQVWDMGGDRAHAMRPITEEFVNSFEDALYDAQLVQAIDPEIRLILWEEIQMYFAGDRSFEDTVDVINDRAQTVVDERG